MTMRASRARRTISFLTVGLCFACGIATAGAASQAPFKFQVNPADAKVRVGEPLFLRATLRNATDRAMHVAGISYGLHETKWAFYVRGPNPDAEWTKVAYRLRSLDYAGRVPKLDPGEARSSFFIIWFRSGSAGCGTEDGDLDPLMFRRPGEYRYRLRLEVPFRHPGGEVGRAEVAAEGRAEVGPCADEAAARLFCRKLRHQYPMSIGRQEAEELLDALPNSPYRKYGKWLRIEAAINEGFDTTERGGGAAMREVARLRELSRDVLAEFAGSGVPPERAARVANGIVHLVQAVLLEQYRGDGTRRLGATAAEETGLLLPMLREALPHLGVKGGLEELENRDVAALAARERKAAEETLKDLKDRFPPSKGIRRLEDWLR